MAGFSAVGGRLTFGFTGTRSGMSSRQRATVRYLFAELCVTVLYHGDCIGADAEAHRDAANMAANRSIKIVVHPPSNVKLCAFSVDGGKDGGEDTIILPSKPYLTRNHDIIIASIDGLIAAPKDFIQPSSLRGQGTWATISRAKRIGRKVWIVAPDGTFNVEE